MVDDDDFHELCKRSLLKGMEGVTLDELIGFEEGLRSRRKTKKTRVRKSGKKWGFS